MCTEDIQQNVIKPNNKSGTLCINTTAANFISRLSSTCPIDTYLEGIYLGACFCVVEFAAAAVVVDVVIVGIRDAKYCSLCCKASIFVAFESQLAWSESLVQQVRKAVMKLCQGS